MFRPRHLLASEPRRGIILLVVLALLTLFALVGLAFLIYSQSAADHARAFRDSQNNTTNLTLPDTLPDVLFTDFLRQFIYDLSDDASGATSVLRGHSLSRGAYGYNNASANTSLFSGTGRLHFSSPFGAASI